MLFIPALLACTVTARAADCRDNVYVFSRASVSTPILEVGNPAVATETVGCDLMGSAGHPADTRLIVPGSTAVGIRYLRDLGSAVPRLYGTLSGLGLNRQIILTRTPLPTGAFVYDSVWFGIDPLARGTLTVVVTSDIGEETDQYRTAV